MYNPENKRPYQAIQVANVMENQPLKIAYDRATQTATVHERLAIKFPFRYVLIPELAQVPIANVK